MKIKQATIYGFGKWKDQTFTFNSEGMNVISGNNEAGKSTLQQFLLFILFGLPPKQRTFFKPKTGGTVGGLLIVEMEAIGEVILERVDDIHNGEVVCKLPNGEEFGEEWLVDHLHGTNREVFDSIFSFTAADLLKLRQLNGKELGEVLLNLGLTGSDHIYQTEKWLAVNANERFRPKGKNPMINKKLEEIEQLAKERTSKEQETQKYEVWKQKKLTLEKQIEKTTKEMRHTHQEQSSAEQLLKALPALSEYHQRKAGSLERVPFPVDGRERYQQVKEAILPLQSEANLIEKNMADITTHHQELLEKHMDDDAVDQASKLMSESKIYERVINEIAALERRAARLSEQVDGDLIHLDIGLEKQDLAIYTLPFYVEETWRTLQEESKAIQSEEEKVTEEWKKLQTQQGRLSNQIEKIEAEMMNETEAEEAARIVEEAFSLNSKKRYSRDLRKPTRLFSIASVVLLLVGLVIQTSMEQTVWGWLVMSLGIGLGAYGVAWQVRTTKTQDEIHVNPLELEGFRKKLNTYEQQKNEWSYLKDQWKMTAQEELQLEEWKRHVIQKGQRIEARLQEQERLYPFLTHVSIDHWDQLFHLFSQAQERQNEYDQLKREIQEKQNTIDQIKTDLKAFYHVNKWEWNQKQMYQAFERVRNWLEEQREVRNNLNRLLHQEEQEKIRHKELETRLQTLEQERNLLFEKAEVNDEESFYHQLTKYEKHQSNLDVLEQLTQQLKGMLSEEEQSKLNIWDESIKESKVKVKIDELIVKREELETTLHHLQQQLADCKSQIAMLESSEDFSRSLHQLETERNTLNEQAKEWAAYQIAFNLLNQTKNKYKERYLPEVLSTAARHFFRLTSHCYTDIQLSNEREAIMVEHKSRQRYSVEELSRGTQDQLYVSLRIALGETMNSAISFPFLIDDAFVHFDEGRQEKMFAILKELSYDHQVIFMTWRTDSLRFVNETSIQHLS